VAVTQDQVTQHEDAGKHSGNAAEAVAKQVGLGKFGKKINDFVKKFVTKKQKEQKDKAAKGKEVDGAAAPVAATPAENAVAAPAAAPATTAPATVAA